MGKSIWHDFRKEKPVKDGMYVCITPLKYGGYMIHDLLFYTESGLFNWRGEGDDTSMAVAYWAEIEELVAQAKECVL